MSVPYLIRILWLRINASCGPLGSETGPNNLSLSWPGLCAVGSGSCCCPVSCLPPSPPTLVYILSPACKKSDRSNRFSRVLSREKLNLKNALKFYCIPISLTSFIIICVWCFVLCVLCFALPPYLLFSLVWRAGPCWLFSSSFWPNLRVFNFCSSNCDWRM